jgi:hypothetical protein
MEKKPRRDGKQKKANCRLAKMGNKSLLQRRGSMGADEWLIFNCVSGCFLRHIFSPAAVSALEPQGCIAARFLFEHHQRTAIFASRRTEVAASFSIVNLAPALLKSGSRRAVGGAAPRALIVLRP